MPRLWQRLRPMSEKARPLRQPHARPMAAYTKEMSPGAAATGANFRYAYSPRRREPCLGILKTKLSNPPPPAHER
jgi:hypothetical protein